MNNLYIHKQNYIIIGFIFLLSYACTSKQEKQELIIFHAGSLSVPFKQIEKEFEKEYPEVDVVLEAAGSRTCARKITDLGRKCDIMASADYKVIDNLLIPEHALDNFKFATNELVIAYTPESNQADEINHDNWVDILLNPNTTYGRSDPDSDPCGYRSVLVTKLAAIYYNRPEMADSLLQKDQQHIRPKEVDLLALLESKVIDYIFIYKSVATQHELKFIELSDSLNLGNSALSNYYNQVSVAISGKTPHETIEIIGAPMVYGITKPLNGSNPELADKFLQFFFDMEKGLRIIKDNGQNIIFKQSDS